MSYKLSASGAATPITFDAARRAISEMQRVSCRTAKRYPIQPTIGINSRTCGTIAPEGQHARDRQPLATLLAK